MKTRTKYNSRQGVTLLFTISMIVLFLLMGTTFVVVANDYFKTALRRGRLNNYKVDTVALLDRAVYDALRGVSLQDSSSPMRGISILEDQYGYGFTGQLVVAAAIPSNVPSLVQISVNGSDLYRIRNEASVNLATDDTYCDNVYSGCVLTFLNGAAQGYSARIISHNFDTSTGRLQIVIPRDSFGIDWTAVLASDSVLVNGRDFAGTGGGTVNFAGFLNRDGAPATRLDDASLEPNRIGDSFSALLADYLTIDRSPNEGYDAVDHQNMYLGGEDAAGNIIPSLHRDRLYQDRFADLEASGGTVTPYDIRKFSFRPVYLDRDGNGVADPGSTANENFDNKFNADGSLVTINADGSMRPFNSENNLDVDTDNDGQLDAVWIDIGLPIQTDKEGRRFRPLIAYRIEDMDGRLNLNVHGSHADVLATGVRLGAGFGVAEVSLDNVAANYTNLLNSRYGGDNIPGNGSNAFSDTVTFSPDKVRQKLFGYPDHRFPNIKFGNLFNTGGDLFGVNRIMSLPTGANRDALPGYVISSDITGNAITSPYDADFSIGGGVGDNHFEAWEMEELLRADDIDTGLLRGRLGNNGGGLVNNADVDAVTTHSFEVAMPSSPTSVVEILRNRCESQIRNLEGITDPAALRFATVQRVRQLINDQILPPEVLMGGKFNLNRPLGNGRDDDGDGIVDERNESPGRTAQHDQPFLDLDNRGDGFAGNVRARQLMAKQLFALNLLVCGEGIPAGTTGFTAEEYVESVAQWAVNVVDFVDPDSAITVFEFDRNPFNTEFVDGDPSTGLPTDTTPETDRGIVYGFERPELLITETFAHHDRQNQDLDGDGSDRDGGDDDFDSLRIPQSSTFIELYNPWNHGAAATASAYSVSPGEFNSNNLGVDLEATAGNGVGDSPVWRIAVKRGGVTTDQIIRMIYFRDPSGTPPEGNEPNVSGTAYYPSTTNRDRIETIRPGDHMVVGSSGNADIASRAITTFGRRTGIVPSTPTQIEEIRGVELVTTTNNQRVIYRRPNGTGTDEVARVAKVAVIDQPRSLSISEPDAGYPASINDPTSLDGQVLQTQVPLDTPLDSDLPGDVYRSDDDLRAIWDNGVQQNASGGDYVFRTFHLQRLADPTLEWDVNTNPYVTVDSSDVNLLSFNGLNNDANNDGTISGTSHQESTAAGPSGMPLFANDGNTEFRTIERGERAVQTNDENEARRRIFQLEHDPEEITADAAVASSFHNFDYEFEQTLGAANDAHNSNGPLGWLTFNNRPFANEMELFNVPIGSNLTSLRLFNEIRPGTVPPANFTPAQAFAFYMSDENFGHVIGYGQNLPGGTGMTKNRFDHILDFVEAPNRFLGSEKWIPANTTLPINSSTVTGLTFAMNAPFHSIPTFRTPGKININTIFQADVWNALIDGFSNLQFNAFENARNTNNGHTDFGNIFTSASGGEFVTENARRGGDSLLFRDNSGELFQANDDTSAEGRVEVNSSTYFDNEVRQRIATATTTRSSVFAIWVTVGYFEVDDQGRVGAELGSDEGEVRRNRAFYMVDRSIPVACEPGKNHNVDQAILVRTIIE